MSLVVREDLSVPLPEDLARRFGIHGGSRIEWEPTEDGRLTLRTEESSEGAGSRLLGILKPYLKEQGGGVEAFLEWRREDARLDGSL